MYSSQLPYYSIPLEFIFKANLQRKLTFGESTGSFFFYLNEPFFDRELV